jgi:hypothetical protein
MCYINCNMITYEFFQEFNKKDIANVVANFLNTLSKEQYDNAKISFACIDDAWFGQYIAYVYYEVLDI